MICMGVCYKDAAKLLEINAYGAHKLKHGCACIHKIKSIADFDKLIPLAEKFLYDNGRFDLWRTAVENFLEAPIFGKGFYGFGMGNVFASFLPWLAHNTVLEFMSATGIVGTLAYLYYRISTAIPFIRRMSYDRLMLALPILITLGMSMIDNYVFHVYTTFIYTLCLAVAFKMQSEEKENIGEKI